MVLNWGHESRSILRFLCIIFPHIARLQIFAEDVKKKPLETLANDEPNLYLNGWRAGADRAGKVSARFGSSSYRMPAIFAGIFLLRIPQSHRNPRSDLGDLRDLRDLGDLRDLRDFRDFSDLSDLTDLSDLSDLTVLDNRNDKVT